MPFAQIIRTDTTQGQTDFSFTFPFIKEEHIKLFVNFQEITQGTGSNEFQVITNVTPNLARLNTGLASANTRVEIKRVSSINTVLVDFEDGSTLTASDLDTNNKQSLFIVQELDDAQKQACSIDSSTGIPTMSNQRISNTSDPVNNQDVVTKAFLERTGSVTSAMINDDTIVNADINSNAAIAGTKISPVFGNQNISTTGNLTLNRLQLDVMGTGLISSTQGDISINSNGGTVRINDNLYVQQATDIDGNLNVDGTTNLDAVDIDGAVDMASNLTLAGNADFNGNLDVDGTTNLDATNVVGTLFITGNIQADNISIDGNTISTAAADLTLDSAGGTVQVTDNFSVSGTTNLNGHVNIGNASNDSVSILAAVDTNLNPDATANNRDLGNFVQKWRDIYVDNIKGDSIVTTSTSNSDSKVYSAKRTEALFLRQDSTETLASNVAWTSNDTTVATTGAIDARVRGLITDVGGFRPIANETAFPTTNPDPDDNAGTIVSITALSADRTASAGSGTANTGVLTTGFQTTAGTQVTINGCPNNQVFEQGFGLLVETTSTLNTYTFVRYVADTSSVATVAAGITNINSVANQIDKVEDVADNINQVFLAGNNTVDISTVAGISSNVTTVAGISANVTTVANDGSDIGLVAGSINNVNTTAGSISNVNTVGGAINNVNTVAANNTNINTVAGISANVTTVAGISSNITAVDNNSANINAAVSNASNINSAVSNASNINSAVSNASNINSAVSNASNINTVAGSISNVNTVGTNITNVTNASNFLNNFLQLYLGEASSDPTVDGLGNVVTEGDLYFNTVDKRVRVFNGSVFQNLAEGAVEVAKFATAAFNALYTASAGSNSIDLGGLAITGAVFSNEAIATNRVSLGKGSGTFNLGGI